MWEIVDQTGFFRYAHLYIHKNTKLEQYSYTLCMYVHYTHITAKNDFLVATMKSGFVEVVIEGVPLFTTLHTLTEYGNIKQWNSFNHKILLSVCVSANSCGLWLSLATCEWCSGPATGYKVHGCGLLLVSGGVRTHAPRVCVPYLYRHGGME